MSFFNNQWKKIITYTIPVIIGLLGFTLGWLIFGTDNKHHPEQTVSIAETTTFEQGKQQMYTCSMHPQIRSPNPDDKCPICGMDLIPVPADEVPDTETELPRLRLTERAIALMRIQVWPVEGRQVFVPLRLYGQIGYDEKRLHTIAAWVPGRLERLYVDFTGTVVRKHQPMVEIYSPTLIAAQEEFLQAIRTARKLKTKGQGAVLDTTLLTVEASHDRLRLMGLASEQIKRIEKQGRVDDRLIIPAPLEGIVIERLASKGDYVEIGQPIYRIADLSNLWVQLEVYETDLQWLALKQKVLFTTQSHPGKNFEGNVSFIDPVLNDRTRTVRVRVDIPNPEGLLKPGMLVRGVIETGAEGYQALKMKKNGHDSHQGHSSKDEKQVYAHEGNMPLVIPVTAPLITGERAVVYVQVPEADMPTFEPRDVLLGPRTGGWYIVREGLNEGELVVTNGSFKIDSELQIRGQPSMMQPEGGLPTVHDHGTAVAHAAEPPATPRSEAFQAPSAFKVQLGSLVLANFDLVATLAGDNIQAAQKAAHQAGEMLNQVKADSLVKDRQKWSPLAETMREALEALAKSEDLALQRRHFETFSDALTEAVRAFGVEKTGPVYRAMCPMVQGRKGYWLQPQKDITNPYFGSAMLTCGEIDEMLVETDAHDP